MELDQSCIEGGWRQGSCTGKVDPHLFDVKPTLLEGLLVGQGMVSLSECLFSKLSVLARKKLNFQERASITVVVFGEVIRDSGMAIYG